MKKICRCDQCLDVLRCYRFSHLEVDKPIFIKHKTATLIAINKRLKNKRNVEDKDEAPYDDLVNLKKRLSQ